MVTRHPFLTIILLLAVAATAQAVEPEQLSVFVSGREGYHTYRIPSLVVTKKGTLLAFCEGRKNASGDSGDIDLLLKRSFDDGKTWTKPQVVWDDAENTCGNPCPVVDARTCTIWLLLTHNLGRDTEAAIVNGTSKGTRTVWVMKSDEDGATWSKPIEITKSVKKSDWTWYATGPGAGIQLRSGRLVVPCDNQVAGSKVQQSHIIFSDDGGQTWKLGGVVGPQCDESQIVELQDGTLLLNMRSYRRGNRRLVAVSKDGGQTFSQPVADRQLIEPICQASILAYPGERGAILFSNPASTKREKMTVRLSRDDAKTWSHARVLHDGPSAYSCLAALPGGTIVCLYERGDKNAYETITLARFLLSWLTDTAPPQTPKTDETPARLHQIQEPAAQIGSRRELFVDSFLIDRLTNATLTLEQPRDEGIVLRFDKLWEGRFCGYATVLRDGSLYRLYYRGRPDAGRDGDNQEVTCCALSRDGLTWTKPELGLFEVGCTKANNVVLAGMAPFSHNFCPMLDSRKDVPSDQRYKALAGIGKSGLAAFVSADGLRWRKLRDEPVLTKGAFDSQNVAFWSEHEQCYLCYFRVFVKGIRRIARATSKDFLHWTEPKLMEYGDRPIEHLYTNQTSPYFRAPHLYIGIAARFMPGRQVLSAEQARAIRVDPGYFKDCSDAVLLTTRGGSLYERTFMEGFLCPGIGPENWVSRTNYPALNVVPTGPHEMSFYVNQNYGQPTSHLRRYALRLDGFACVRAPYSGGELVTKPLIFTGNELSLNFATSAAGGIRVEIQDAEGTPLSGYSLADAVETIGNEIDRAVRWKSGSDVGALAGKPVRLRLVMRDARLYALQFRPGEG